MTSIYKIEDKAYDKRQLINEISDFKGANLDQFEIVERIEKDGWIVILNKEPFQRAWNFFP